MNVSCVQRGIRSLCWLAFGAALYLSSFFIFLAAVCRAEIDLSSTQLHVVGVIYRPVFKVLPSPVVSKGLKICAGLSEIEAFFVLGELQQNSF